MIQRIQTIFFLLVSILMAVTVFSPLGEYVNNENISLLFFSSGVGGTIFHAEYPTWGIIVLAIVCAILPLVNIFLYKNRKIQMKLGRFTSLLILFLYVTISVYSNSIISGNDLKFIGIQYGIVLPLIALILNILAILRVKKDEELVRSTERIR
ncbi:MAG: DUF4293 domain-containing protein [Dysgonomonas sp.]